VTFHVRTKRHAQGHRPNLARGHNTSPRISLSLKPETMQRLTERAQNRGVPVAALLREAVDLFLQHRK
jgi:hypothetical protein